jgi:type IV pilus assembly protein PilP
MKQISIVKNGILKGCTTIIIIFAMTSATFANQPKNNKVKEYEKRLQQILAPVAYKYNPLGKPDPFKPFLRTNTGPKKIETKSRPKAIRPDECATPLECIDIGQLTLVAVVTGDDSSSWAMAQDASGIGYLLKKGMKVGYRGGKIVAILPEKVIIRETIEDLSGKKIKRNRVLYLHPEEQE